MRKLFIDIDDTLILYQHVGPNPYGVYMGTPWSTNEKLLEGIRTHAAENPTDLIIVWSGGGRQYAQMWTDQLGIDDLVFCMDKNKYAIELIEEGDIAVDDMDTPWRTHDPFEWPE